MTTSTALVTLDTNYAALKLGDQLPDIISENLGGGSIDVTMLPKVKIPAGGSLIWEIESLGESTGAKEIQGIVVAFHDQRAFWPGEMTGGGDPPDCSSPDAVMGRARLDPDGAPLLWGDNKVPGIQACASCPFSQFGSGKNGTGQACKQSRILYLLQAGELLPTIVSLSPTSIRPVQQFFQKLISRQIRLSSVEIGLTLKQVVSGSGIKYSMVEPRLSRQLNEDEARAMAGYSASLRPMLQQHAA